MKKHTRIFLVVSILSILGLGWFHPSIARKRFEYKRAKYLQIQKENGRYQNWESELPRKTVRAAKILNAPDKVEIFRLSDVRLFGDPRYREPRVDGIAYSSKNIYNDSAAAKRLSDLVLQPYSYSLTSKACIFNPAIAFRFSKGKETALIALCFECNQLALIENDPTLPLTSIDGPMVKLRFLGDIDFYRPEFLDIAKAAFPNDQEIQKLETYKNTFL